ncbi:MAG: cell division protein FtsZ [Alphaproteobacteria bacterium]
MTIHLSMPRNEPELRPRITVIGVGGAGGNAVDNMIRSNLEGVEFIIANTDCQALSQSACERQIKLGINITRGLGAGARPDVGRAAAEEAMEELLDHLGDANMVFITAGMGGGTGTGAAPVIARAARERGILTIGVVTKPFHFEGTHRMRIADAGIDELQNYVDTLIVIPNQNLFRVANERTTFADAFKMADDVLYSGVRGVTDLMIMPGLINLDFADIRSVMGEMGKAMMGTGEGDGERRALDAAEAAISNPLLDDVSMEGARGILINVTGGMDMTLFEVDEAANRIRAEVDPNANIIFGSTFHEEMEGTMRVSVVATGIDVDQVSATRPHLKVVHDAVAEKTVGQGEPQPVVAVAASSPPASDDAQAATAQPTEEDAPPADTLVHAAASSSDDHAPSSNEGHMDQAAAETATTPDSGETALAARAHGEPFIAPPPVTTGRRPAVSRPEPFAEADMVNGRGQPMRGRRGPSLFERVTGTGRARRRPDETRDPEASAATAGPVATRPATTGEPAPAPRQPEAAAEHPARPAGRPQVVARQATPQAQLGGLTATERPGRTPHEDDLLDIPAFLRRQAN